MTGPLHFAEGPLLGRYVYGNPNLPPEVKAKKCGQCEAKWRPGVGDPCGCIQDEYQEYSVTEEHWFETESLAQAEGF